MSDLIQVSSLFILGACIFTYIEFKDSIKRFVFKNTSSEKKISIDELNEQVRKLNEQISKVEKESAVAQSSAVDPDNILSIQTKINTLVNTQTEVRTSLREIEKILIVFQKQIKINSDRIEVNKIKKSA